MNNQIAIVGRTNVGKSLLFNKLTKQRKALVIDLHGVTKDINCGYLINHEKKSIQLYDTSGFTESIDKRDTFYNRTIECIDKCDLILYVISLNNLLNSHDKQIISDLRKKNKKIILIVNKIDLKKKNDTIFDAFQYGIENTFEVSAKDNNGINELKNYLISIVKGKDISHDYFKRISIIGKPNAGKSTLINTLINTKRMITSDQPGTTIDCIDHGFTYRNKRFLLIDTAGLGRKSKSRSKLSSYSMLNTLDTIKHSDISFFLLDASAKISKQDKIILESLKSMNKPHIIIVNKVDLLNKTQINEYRKYVEYFLNISSNATCIFLSASMRKNISQLKREMYTLAVKLDKRYKSSLLTKILNDAIESHPLPMSNNKKIKLKFAQQTKSDQLTITIHGNRISKIPKTYDKYLCSFFTKKLSIRGVPIKIIYSKQENPFM